MTAATFVGEVGARCIVVEENDAMNILPKFGSHKRFLVEFSCLIKFGCVGYLGCLGFKNSDNYDVGSGPSKDHSTTFGSDGLSNFSKKLQMNFPIGLMLNEVRLCR